jgi:thymidylate synthase ThyX
LKEKAYILLAKQENISNRKAKELIDRGLVYARDKKVKIARGLMPVNTRFKVIKLPEIKKIYEDKNILVVDKPPFIVSEEIAEKFKLPLLHRVELYNKMIEKGIKPEKARSILPLSLYTEFWLQGDYLGLLNFFVHRLFPEAQEETRITALSMLKLLKKHQIEIINTMKERYSSWIKKTSNLFFKSREDKINKLKPLLEVKDESGN